jgi:hypothetical protein
MRSLLEGVAISPVKDACDHVACSAHVARQHAPSISRCPLSPLIITCRVHVVYALYMLNICQTRTISANTRTPDEYEDETTPKIYLLLPAGTLNLPACNAYTLRVRCSAGLTYGHTFLGASLPDRNETRSRARIATRTSEQQTLTRTIDVR